MTIMQDTIAGLATAPGRSETGIVRVSGPGSSELLEACFVPKEGRGDPGGFYFLDGDVRCGADAAPVPCRVFVMKTPHSYTREDVVEFHLPGSPELTDLFLRWCFSHGARMPEPGEFTKRAFLNGRIDLVEAAGVMEIISASDAAQLESARDLCFGNVSAQLQRIENRVRDLLALTELSIDFSDQDLEIISQKECMSALDEIIEDIRGLRKQDRIGRDAAGETHIVIAGMVNAGKSTLFNTLLGSDRCRVSPVPGTTRDMVSGTGHINSIPFVLYDSAGLSVRPGIFEEHARRIFRNRAGTGMLLLVSPETEMPCSLRDLFLEKPGPDRTIVVGTKADLGIRNRSLENGEFSNCYAVTRISEQDAESIRGLKGIMADFVRDRRVQQSFSMTGMLDAVLEAAGDILLRLREHIDIHTMPECAAEELRAARAELDRFGSDDPDQDILNRIFSSFCIGK